MRTIRTQELADPDAALAFYEDRYAHGYMDEWPRERYERIVEVIRAFDLPPSGAALDFGCGAGALTGALREALPGWRVAGCDLSPLAIANARRRNADCEFFVAGDSEIPAAQFDFVFSHHVLEHVADLRGALSQIDRLMKPHARMLHLLPCGDPGSYEHKLCLLRKDGIQRQLGNRFFFEDEGHMHRLTTREMTDLLTPFGYELRRAWFGNQHDAAIEWITAAGQDFVRMITDPDDAVDEVGARKLRAIRRSLLPLAAMREFVQRTRKMKATPKRDWRDWFWLAVRWPIYRALVPVDERLRARAQAEWRTRRSDPGGSEMVLFFTRGGGGARL